MPVAPAPDPPAPRRPVSAVPVARAPRPPFLAEEEPSQPTRRFWVPGTDAGPGTMVLLPDAREGVWVRAFRLVVLVGCFLAGGALATVAFPWVETALDRAVDEVRSVTQAGFAHSPDPGAAGAPPAGSARP